MLVAGTAALTDCRLHDNTALTSGGGLSVTSRGDASLTSCGLYNNSASSGGGGIQVDGEVALVDSSIQANVALQVRDASSSHSAFALCSP